MSVTITSITRIGRRAWRVVYASTLSAPTFYIYVNAELVGVTTETAYQFQAAPGESVILDVFDSSTDTPEDVYPGRLAIAWYAVVATDYYRIDEYLSGEWVEVGRVRDTGAGYFKWRTRWLEDSASHQFRVIAVGDNGNESTAATLSCLMVRHPDVPDVNLSYDAEDGTLTIAQA